MRILLHKIINDTVLIITPVFWPKTSKTLFGPVHFSVFTYIYIYIYIYIYTVKPVLRGDLWDKEKVAF
jgi:hypothetical protein